MSLILDLIDTQTSIIAILIFIVGVFYVTRRSNKSSGKLPPSGPREWPLVGCAPSLVGDEPYKLLAAMTPRYGPVFLTRIGMIPTLVLNDYESIKEAFVRSGDDFSDRPRIGMIDYITKGRGIVSAHVGESQQEKRRFGLAALRSLGMGKSRLVENITDEISSLTDVFEQRNCEPFIPFHDIEVSVSNIISWIIYAKRFAHNDTEFGQILNVIHEGMEICEMTGAIGLIPGLEYLPLPIWRRLDDNHAKWKKFTDALIKEVLERPEGESHPCVVQMFNDEIKQSKDCVEKAEQDRKSIFNQDELVQLVGDFFAAGTDTTATTLAWAILYLLLYPEVQHKVHEELDAAIGQDRMPTLEDRKSLPYTEAVLLEIQRNASIVPFAVPHSTYRDTKLFDYHISKGTFVLPNIWAVHHDPSVWENPEEFRPERFLNDDRNAVVQREELIQFCIGRRKCLGEQLARMELFLFFTHLVHRFEFRLPEGAPPLSTTGRPGATRTPMPYNVCAIPRKSSKKQK